ncbi:MAG TPA: hypothetical protein VNY36_04040 [Bacteroidia bacterium]|jgi:hypothetical protein|nr:hypothetical protein [Bacteroidia bacterium]
MKTNQLINPASKKMNSLNYKSVISFLVMLTVSVHFSSAQNLTSASVVPAPVQVIKADTLNMLSKVNKATADSMTNFYYLGGHDADNNYTAKKSGKRVVFFTSLIGSPIIGLIPAIISSATYPSVRNLKIRDKNLLHNKAYMKGYRDEAHDIKKRAVWGNYLAGSVVWIAIANIILL